MINIKNQRIYVCEISFTNVIFNHSSYCRFDEKIFINLYNDSLEHFPTSI